MRAAGDTATEPAVSTRALRDIEADTDADSAFWRSASPIYADKDNAGNPLPGYRAEIRSRWTARHLYFLFLCPFERLNLNPSPRTDIETNQLWNWDVAEVFIGATSGNPRRYKEFEVSPQGEWVDLDVDLDAPRHEDGWVWTSGIKAAARIDPMKQIWHAFLRIPFVSLDCDAPAEGNAFRVNFFVSQWPRPIAWKPTRAATFHVPEAFGVLRLG